ncbi:flavonol 7-O-rhamnosyltransferase-like [Humulus lupulus]|uniref:flavonol 7-O-rhamnosyltransferase-like n=1 Tax=Humulus lupulus TaxID=3486 RepID=UPI002B4183BF|nr:flavonol 7-O-rhamnosyltransferase-like [Humulus lupulus]
MTSFTNKKKTHILVIPYPAQGHMLPLMDLSNQLAIRGVAITILATPKNLPILDPLLSSHPHSIETLLLPFPQHPSVPAGVENMQELPISFLLHILSALAKLHDPILAWFHSHPSPPTAIISDSFLSTWTCPLARRLGIRRLGFAPVHASTLSAWWGEIESNNGDQNIFKGHKDILESHAATKASDGLILNTLEDLDRGSLDHLKATFLGQQPIWAVGPLLPMVGPTKRGGDSSMPEEVVMAWLDSCHMDKSVVYVGFGSQVTLTGIQMEALADALDRSRVRFIWVVKDPMRGVQVASNQGVVPLGFEDRVAGRGLVIRGWAPQVAILGHRAVGSYLSHCGWNSALEGLLAGTLLLAWPMQADHFENAKLLVDKLGVAIRVCEGLDTVPDSVNLAKVLAESISSTRHERAQAMELRKVALDATKPCGSSYVALDELVNDLDDR